MQQQIVISWSLFIALLGAMYWVYGRPRSGRAKRIVSDEKVVGSSVFLSSGAEGAQGERKKGKKKKAALPSILPKKVVSNEDESRAAESTDDEVAHEEDETEVLRRLQALNEGSRNKRSTFSSSSTVKQSASQKPNLVAPASPFATASQASSTGADADIDEEDATQLPGSGFQQSSSTDPSDMVEESGSGVRVLTIVPSTQPPRPQKQKNTAPSSSSGVHTSKNAKKKEKKKLEKEVERADQKARFEQHRATMRAAEAAKQKTNPSPETPPIPSAWTKANGDTSSSSATPSIPISKPVAVDLLDTFTPPSAPVVSQHTPVDSEEEKNPMKSTYLDGSYWEEIPDHLIGGWNEVQRKGRRQKKSPADAEAGKSGDESSGLRSRRESFQAKTEKPVISKKENTKSPAVDSSKGGNGFQLLDTGSNTSDTKNSSSDWAEADDSDNWAVHPES